MGGGGGLLVGEAAEILSLRIEDRGLSLTSSTTRDGLPGTWAACPKIVHLRVDKIRYRNAKARQ